MPLITRRRFLTASLASIVGTVLYTWRWEPHWAEFVERTMPIPGLPRSLHGKTMVQVSDIHVGKVVDQHYLMSMIERVNAVKPDLLLLTGDFMTCEYDEQLSAVSELLQFLKPTPLGTFASLGNHDYGAGWKQADVADQLVDRLSELRIRTLRNELTQLDGLQLIGLDDLWANRMQPEAVLAKLDRQQPCLTLCHNPDGVDWPIMQQIPGWVLAGHTHGGQCKPPFLAPPILPVKNLRYTSGAFQLDSQRQLYINRGLGYNMRVRFNARPEVTIFRLERADAVT